MYSTYTACLLLKRYSQLFVLMVALVAWHVAKSLCFMGISFWSRYCGMKYISSCKDACFRLSLVYMSLFSSGHLKKIVWNTIKRLIFIKLNIKKNLHFLNINIIMYRKIYRDSSSTATGLCQPTATATGCSRGCCCSCGTLSCPTFLSIRVIRDPSMVA